MRRALTCFNQRSNEEETESCREGEEKTRKISGFNQRSNEEETESWAWFYSFGTVAMSFNQRSNEEETESRHKFYMAIKARKVSTNALMKKRLKVFRGLGSYANVSC